MSLLELKENVEKLLKKESISGKIVLNNFSLNTDFYKKSSIYNDYYYYPFYFYLGRLLKSKVVLEIGSNIGLISGAYLSGCKSVDHKVDLFLSLKNQENYNNFLIKSNINRTYKGEIKFIDDLNSINQEIDLVLINQESSYDEILYLLEFLFPKLSDNGRIVLDKIFYNKNIKDAYKNFCNIKNITEVVIESRFGSGLI